MDFMDLAKPGDIKHHCDPNALTTFLEYLIDYGSADLRGIDLNIGGEGMKAFYDRILPNVANGLLKKFGGGRVDAGQVANNAVLVKAFGLDSHEAVGMDQQYTDQPGFDLTPELSAQALRGLPLFSQGTVSQIPTALNLKKLHLLQLDAAHSAELFYDTYPWASHQTAEDYAASWANSARDEIKELAELQAHLAAMESTGKVPASPLDFIDPLPLSEALAATRDRIERTQARLERYSGKARAAIAEWHRLVADNPEVAKAAGIKAPRFSTGSLDHAERTRLQALATALENPRAGQLLHVTQDGRALATGDKGATVPARFAAFAQAHALPFEAHRSVNVASEPMPADYRNSGALYAAEIGNGTDPSRRFDGATRFSQGRAPAMSLIGDSGRDYLPAQRAAFGHTGRLQAQRGMMDWLADQKKDFGKKMIQGVFDQFAPVKDVSPQAYLQLRLAKGGAVGAFEALLQHGKLRLDGDTFNADQSGGVLEKVFFPLGREATDFLYWIAGHRAEALMPEDREHLFSKDDIAAHKSLATGDTPFAYTLANGKVTTHRALIYPDALKKFNTFQKNVLDMAEQAGLIDGATRYLWEHEFYVPFYRVMPDDEGLRGGGIRQGVIRQQAFKRLKGGSEGLNDLLGNTLANWAHLLDASAKNRAATTTLKAAVRLGGARQATYGEKNTVWHMGQIERKIPAGTEYVDGGVLKIADADTTMETVGKVEYVVDDPFLLDAISALDYVGLRGGMMDALGGFKRLLTYGVTFSPHFKVRNLIRDSLQAVATSSLPYNVLANVKAGWQLTDHSTQAYVSALAGGGLIRFGTMLEGDEATRTRQLIKQGTQDSHILDSEGKVTALIDRLEPLLTWYNELGNRGEEINRMALYAHLVKPVAEGGGGKPHAEAALAARDLMDFGLQGTFRTVRFLSQVVPFFNARLQGVYKLGRAAKEDPAKFAAVTGAMMLFSLALLAHYHDDDDWQKREDWDRNNYWWIKIGGEAYRIPKPFEIGALATLAERSAERLFDDAMTGERFRTQLLAILNDQLALNPTPQLVKPLIDLYANHDSFTNRPIETQGMENVQPSARYRPSTSLVARGLSSAGNAVSDEHFASPVQIDHLIRGYFGWVGTFAVAGIDMAIRPMLGDSEPATPATDWLRTLTGSMVSELDGAPSRYVSAMYDQAKELEQAYGTWRRLLRDGKREEAAGFAAEHADQIKRYHLVEPVRRATAVLNEQIRRVSISDATPQAKREKITALRERQHGLAQKVVP
jgi:hypothetical protein